VNSGRALRSRLHQCADPSVLRDPRFIREFKAAHCVEVFAEHATTKKKCAIPPVSCSLRLLTCVLGRSYGEGKTSPSLIIPGRSNLWNRSPYLIVEPSTFISHSWPTVYFSYNRPDVHRCQSFQETGMNVELLGRMFAQFVTETSRDASACVPLFRPKNK
jgi:hypothetical protein